MKITNEIGDVDYDEVYFLNIYDWGNLGNWWFRGWMMKGAYDTELDIAFAWDHDGNRNHQVYGGQCTAGYSLSWISRKFNSISKDNDEGNGFVMKREKSGAGQVNEKDRLIF